MMMSKGFQPWRRGIEAFQALFIIALPFIRINGESALRFDIPSLRLHFFGVSLWMDEFFIILVALIFLTFLFVLITLLFGRIWCGWSCPQTVLCDLTSFIEGAKKKGVFRMSMSYAVTLAVSILVAANLIWYFVSPYEFLQRLAAGSPGQVISGFWTVLTVIIFLDLVFLRRVFCTTVCPYAKFQSTLYDRDTLVIAPDPEAMKGCIECLACVKACPTGIDIRAGSSTACINCAECIDACGAVMKRRGRDSLIGYFFGSPGEGRKLVRQNTLIIGAVTAAFLFYFVYLLAARSPLDLTVLPNNEFQPRVSGDGRVINSYILSVKNRGTADMALKAEIYGSGGDVRIVPQEQIHVPAGQKKDFPIYVSIGGLQEEQRSKDMEMILWSADQEVKARLKFIIPEGR